jgi:hypothetical protein
MNILSNEGKAKWIEDYAEREKLLGQESELQM